MTSTRIKILTHVNPAFPTPLFGVRSNTKCAFKARITNDRNNLVIGTKQKLKKFRIFKTNEDPGITFRSKSDRCEIKFSEAIDYIRLEDIVT